MIIARYITKELFLTLIAITGILLLIALSNRFAVYLAKAATGELPISLVFRLVWLYTPELLSYVVPLSFFMAIIFVYGRLHVDSEMAVLWACGFGWGYISRITLLLSGFLMISVAALTLYFVPKMTVSRDQVVAEGGVLAVINSLLPGRFQTLMDGRIVFYIEDTASQTKSLNGIFIAEQPKPSSSDSNSNSDSNSDKDSKLTVVTAHQASIKQEPNTQDFYLVLKQGYRYQGNPGQANYSMVKFKEYGRAVKQGNPNTATETVKQKSSFNLLRSSALSDKAEFQWRMSIPLSLPILGLLAIPLSRVRPRQGRFGKFLPAIVLYIIYYNLFTLSKRWIDTGTLPSQLGVWWVHGLFLLLALFLLAKESGWFWEVKHRFVKAGNASTGNASTGNASK